MLIFAQLCQIICRIATYSLQNPLEVWAIFRPPSASLDLRGPMRSNPSLLMLCIKRIFRGSVLQEVIYFSVFVILNNEDADLQARDNGPSSLYPFESRWFWHISMIIEIPTTKLHLDTHDLMVTILSHLARLTMMVAVLSFIANTYWIRRSTQVVLSVSNSRSYDHSAFCSLP